jgi:2-polyprenyl-3-methyl-5-hydroxy-6-metoxy-1,4-benzoquinol methylase
MAFVVPPKFYRNGTDVIALGPPAEIGSSLLAYMCERIGIPDLNGVEMLDFGCGSRFADTIVNRGVPVKSYAGIDVHKDLIRFLQKNVRDPRFSFYHLNARSPSYNKRGVPMTAKTSLPLGERKFDVICMFSVITHQLPDDASAIFHMLRQHVRPTGHLFFSTDLDDGVADYGERYPESPTALSVYSPALLRRLLQAAGWEIQSVAPKNPRDLAILDSVLCAPI